MARRVFLHRAILAASLAVPLAGCIDTPLSDEEIGARIEQQSKPYPTPLLVADCLAEKCADNANNCQDACFAGASEVAKEAGDKLWACWKPRCQDDMCKASSDTACMSKCLASRCGPELSATLSKAKTGDQGCAPTYTCMEGCDPKKPGLFSCFDDCFNRATKDGQAALLQLAECSAGNNGEVQSKCHVELVACYSDTVANNGECHTSMPCLETCSDNNAQQTVCYQKCRDKLSDEAKAQFDALVPCFDNKGNDGKCTKALQSCIDPSGARTCLQTYTCQQQCKAKVASIDKNGCLYSCMHNAEASAYAHISGMSGCGEGGDADACGKALIGCAAPDGTVACKDVQPCVTSCTGGADDKTLMCVVQCLEKASKTAAQQYVDLLLCLYPCQDKCGDKPGCSKACQATCSKQLNACSTG